MEIFTIGHSSLGLQTFTDVLRHHGVTAIADVRSSPYSRYSPQYNRDLLKTSLESKGMTYVFLGKELGGRPKDPNLYTSGVADYEKMSRSSLYLSGMERLERGIQKFRIALMCSERSPLDCHRCLLVGRSLHENMALVTHIIPGEANISQSDVERQLLKEINKSETDMFEPHEQRRGDAYRARARKVAFVETPDQFKGTAAE